MNESTKSVLLVDDEPQDLRLLKQAFTRVAAEIQLFDVTDGQKAIRYLDAGMQRPNLILLDLDRPALTGFDVLRWVRSSASLRHLPILVLTGSSNESDIRKAYEEGANGYLVKSPEFDGMLDMARMIKHYWFSALQLPR
ncbi:MAG: response regulator [Planctomycetota bacterium]